MTEEPPLRVWVFIDSQNLYRDARRAFHAETDPSSYGQIQPMLLGEMLASRGPENATRERVLDQVRLYTGFPTPDREPRPNAIHLRHRAVWLAWGVKVFPRPLQYPTDWPKSPKQEKGIDVALAIDVLFHAVRRDYDVGIVCSTDTDINPAIQAVCEQQRAWGTPRIEVASWGPTGKRLRVDGYAVWCHWLKAADYEAVRDHTNYTL